MDGTKLGALEGELARLRRSMREMMRNAAAAAHPELDAAGYAFLLAIRDLTSGGGAPRLGDLAELMNLHKSSASRAVSMLESLQLAERLPDPVDARARLVGLTDAGQAALERSADRWHEILIARTDDWTQGDLDRFVALLSRFSG